MVFNKLFKRKNIVKDKSEVCKLVEDAIQDNGNPWVSINKINTDESIYFRIGFVAKEIDTSKKGFIRVSLNHKAYKGYTLELIYDQLCIRYIRIINQSTNSSECILNNISNVDYTMVVNNEQAWQYYKSCELGYYDYALAV